MTLKRDTDKGTIYRSWNKKNNLGKAERDIHNKYSVQSS